MHIVDAKHKVEETFWKLALIKQAVRGIVHRATTGDSGNVEDEALPVEDVIDDVQAELERVVAAIGQDAAA
jgi:hypothetical protein